MALHLAALAVLLTRPTPAVWGPLIPVTLVTLPGLKAPAIQQAPAMPEKARVKETIPAKPALPGLKAPAIREREPQAPAVHAAPVAGLSGPILPPGMQDSPFSFYFQILTDRVNAALRLPTLEYEFPPSRRTEVSFRILADGGVDALSLRRRSGDGGFDSSALRAVQSAAPFPPLPDGFPDQELRIVYGF
ncbi:MAG: TonB family protein, partial [bacterium]